MKHPLRTLAIALFAAGVLSNSAAAQQYPSQPIKIIVSLAPGGVADITARATAQTKWPGFGPAIFICV